MNGIISSTVFVAIKYCSNQNENGTPTMACYIERNNLVGILSFFNYAFSLDVVNSMDSYSSLRLIEASIED